MVFGWLSTSRQQQSQRSNSISGEDEGRRRSMSIDDEELAVNRNRRESIDSLLEAERQAIRSAAVDSPSQTAPAVVAPQRRRSIFEMRAPFASDRFSREYADAMDDMWVAECDQGDAGRAGQGILQGALFQRKVGLGQDGFSREYFDTMEDMFVGETAHGDSGYLFNNPHQPTFDRIPDKLRQFGQSLFRPVKFGHDDFSREYAREGEDVWLAQAGKGPSGRASSDLLQRARLGSDGQAR